MLRPPGYVLIILTLCLGISATIIRTEESIPFYHSTIELQNQIITNWFITPDMDNDGLNEFIIQTDRRLDIYQSSNTTKPELKKISSFQLPENIWMYHYFRFPNEKFGGLIGMTPEDVIYLPFNNGLFQKQPKTIIKFADVFESETKEDILFQKTLTTPLLQKFTYDSWFIIPRQRKLFLIPIEQAPNKLLKQVIDIPTNASHQMGDELTEPVYSTVSLPLFYFTDIDNDQKKDLVIYFDNYFSIFLYNNANQFNQISNKRIDVALSRRRKQEQELEFNYEIVPILKDINNDSLPDILLSDGSKGLTAVYLNKGKDKGFFLSQKPDYIKRTKGWLISADLTDLNNDGHPDLVLLIMRKVGVASGIKMLLAHSINWEMEIYLGQNSGNSLQLFPDNPNYTQTMNVPFTLALTNTDELKLQTPFILDFHHDFNGDRINDLLLKQSNQKELAVYFGHKEGAFNRNPDITCLLQAPGELTATGLPYGQPLIYDFNKDGKSDIVIHQQDFAERHHFFEFFLSK